MSSQPSYAGRFTRVVPDGAINRGTNKRTARALKAHRARWNNENKMEHGNLNTSPQPQGWIAEVDAALLTGSNMRALTQVGDLLRAIDRKVLRDVLPAWARVTALAGVRVIPEDWTGGRAKFSQREDRDKAWARLSGLVALALANADSLDASTHWRLASSFIRYLALLEYQNAVTQLSHQRDHALTLDEVTQATSDVRVFGSYAGVLS